MKPQSTQTTDGVTSTGTPAISELDQLNSLANQVDSEHMEAAPDGTPLADVQPPTNYAIEAAATVDTFAALIGGYCPPAGALWDTDRKAAVTAALAPVMEKYGFTLGALPPELTLIIVAGPLLYQTSKIVAGQIGADRAKAAQAQAKSTPQAVEVKPGEVTTGPEVARHPQTSLYK